jgi:hypothetical protein
LTVGDEKGTISDSGPCPKVRQDNGSAFEKADEKVFFSCVNFRARCRPLL